jgi:chromosome partitioning protein
VAYLGLAGEVLRRQREREQQAKAAPQEQKETTA